jgi:hypothetical protein
MGIEVGSENVVFDLTPEAFELVSAPDAVEVSASGGIVVTQGDDAKYVPADEHYRVSGDFSVKNNTGSHIQVSLTLAGDEYTAEDGEPIADDIDGTETE